MRILFLDDDKALLRGMERMLITKSGDWSMVFVDSGTKALERMDREPFDLIVADLRMPGMDGATVLQEVQRRHPSVVRIVLSGHSDWDIVTRAVQPAHQFLSKPCGSDELIHTIQRAMELKTLFTNPQLRDIITRIDTLPVTPLVFTQLTQALQAESYSLSDIGDIVAQDAGLSANILKVVNSSFFGLRRAISTPNQAVTYLGVNILKGLLLYGSVFKPLDVSKQLFSLESLWAHSLLSARFASGIAESEGGGKAQAEECLVATLLHDIGKLVLAEGLHAEYREVVAFSQERNVPLAVAEKERWGVTHAEVGGYLLGLWGFDPHVVQLVACHHGPQQGGALPDHIAFTHAANILEHELVVLHPHYAPHVFVPELLARGGGEEKLEAWRAVCAKVLGDVRH